MSEGVSLPMGASSVKRRWSATSTAVRRLAQVMAFAGITVILLAVVVLPRVSTLQVVVVSGGSMGDALPIGSLAWLRPVATRDVQVGDIALVTVGEPFLHRVVAAEPSGDSVAFQTRGDVNDSADAHPLTVSAEGTVDRVTFAVPFLGYAVSAIQVPAVRAGLMLLLLVLALSQLSRSSRTRSS